MDFPADVVRFIEHRFSANQSAKVYSLLSSKGINTTRVARSILYLSDGRVSLLEHFTDQAIVDADEVLLQAEYETNITQRPVLVRDMSLPFNDEDNLGPDFFRIKPHNDSKRATKRLTIRKWKLVGATR